MVGLGSPEYASEDEITARVSDQSKSEQKTDSVRKRSAHYPLRFVCLVTVVIGNSFICGIESLNDERVAAAGHYSE